MPRELPEDPRHAAWPLAHRFIVTILVFQSLYSCYQVFVVLAPAGHVGLLFNVADDIDPALLMSRRLYAIEGWIAFVGLVVYLALTEPRLRR